MTAPLQNRPNPVNHAMLMGLEVGVWFALNFIVSAQQLRHPSLWLLSWMITLYVVYGIYRAAQHYKHFECADKIRFSQAYVYILWLIMCASLVAAIIRFAYLQWVDTEFVHKVYEQIMLALDQHPELLIAQGTTATKEAFSDYLQYILTPIRLSVYWSMFNVFSGALLALVMAPFVVFVKARFLYPFGGKNDNNADSGTNSEN